MTCAVINGPEEPEGVAEGVAGTVRTNTTQTSCFTNWRAGRATLQRTFEKLPYTLNASSSTAGIPKMIIKKGKEKQRKDKLRY